MPWKGKRKREKEDKTKQEDGQHGGGHKVGKTHHTNTSKLYKRLAPGCQQDDCLIYKEKVWLTKCVSALLGQMVLEVTT